jgi:hypothetical protein
MPGTTASMLMRCSMPHTAPVERSAVWLHGTDHLKV